MGKINLLLFSFELYLLGSELTTALTGIGLSTLIFLSVITGLLVISIFSMEYDELIPLKIFQFFLLIVRIILLVGSFILLISQKVLLDIDLLKEGVENASFNVLESLSIFSTIVSISSLYASYYDYYYYGSGLKERIHGVQSKKKKLG